MVQSITLESSNISLAQIKLSLVLYNGERVSSQYDDDRVKNGWQKECLPTGQRKNVAYKKLVRKKGMLSLLAMTLTSFK